MKPSTNLVLLLFIGFLDISSSAKKSDVKQVKSSEDAIQWLNKFGYNPCFNSTVQCSLSFSSMLKDFQKRFKLAMSGILDEPTQKQMSRPRCGNRDKPAAPLRAIAELSQWKWPRSSLTYSINSYPTQFGQTVTKNIVREAFKAWTDYVPLTIEEACPTCKPDFVLEFARGQHSDNYPFDGVGQTLAHAFFPTDGRVHFDKDEIWSERFDGQDTNLFLVAVHEIGHALGLDHVYNTESIMYPSYQPMAKSGILPQFDRYSIQNIYGKKESTRSTSTTTTSRYTPRTVTTTRSSIVVPGGKPHPRCRVSLDAAFDHPDGTLHTFDTGILWRYLPDERAWDGRASTYRRSYSGLPDKLVAGAYNSRTKEAVFFTDTRVYQFTIDSQNRARLRKEESLPRNLQNAIVGALYYHGAIHVITGNNIRSFQLGSSYQQSDERDLTEEFPQFSGTVKTAFSYGDLHHFFTREDLVYVWDERLKTWETFGKPMESGWFACSGSRASGSRYAQTEKPAKRRGSQHRHYDD